MTQPLLLVVAPSCITSINRAVYRYMVEHKNVNVHLVLPTHSVIEGVVKECEPVDEEPFPCHLLEPSGPKNRLLRFKGLRKLVRSIQPSHVIAEQGPACFSTFQIIREIKGSTTKIWAITVDNIERNYFREAFYNLLRGKFILAMGRFITWYFYWSSGNKVNHVFTLSKESSRIMSKLGFEGRITQIPLGFDPEIFYPQSKEKVVSTRNRLGLQTKTIAYFGRLTPEKGVEILLEALNQLKELSWQLLIDNFSVYTTPYATHLYSQIERLGLGNRVVYFDALHKEMPDYMNASDVVVLPSITTPTFKEQYGRVIPEAMACGKIIIASRSGALPELVGDCGFTFPEGDVKALAGLLRHLLTAPENELDTIREKAAHRANTHLSIVRQAEIWTEMLLSNKM